MPQPGFHWPEARTARSNHLILCGEWPPLATEEDFVHAGYVAAHLGHRDRAVDYLKRGVAAGRGDTYSRFARWDLDLEPLWGYPPFEELIAPKR